LEKILDGDEINRGTNCLNTIAMPDAPCQWDVRLTDMIQVIWSHGRKGEPLVWISYLKQTHKFCSPCEFIVSFETINNDLLYMPQGFQDPFGAESFFIFFSVLRMYSRSCISPPFVKCFKSQKDIWYHCSSIGYGSINETIVWVQMFRHAIWAGVLCLMNLKIDVFVSKVAIIHDILPLSLSL
jgi:hypothetical protein